VACSGRLFQTRAAPTGKAHSPTVDSRVRLTISDEDELKQSKNFKTQIFVRVNNSDIIKLRHMEEEAAFTWSTTARVTECSCAERTSSW